MNMKSLAMDFKGLKAMQKRAIYLVLLFAVVILGAWGIKVGVDTGYIARVQQLLANMNIFKAGITLNAPGKTNSTDLGQSTASDSTNNGTNNTAGNNATVNATQQTEPMTRAARIAKMIELAKIADREVKKMAQLEQITEKVSAITASIQTAKIDATGADKQALSSMEANLAQIKTQTDAINQQLLLNISQSISQIQAQVNLLIQQGPSAL